MANDIFKLLTEGNVDSSVVTECIKQGKYGELLSSQNIVISEDFVPEFLDYLRAKLSVHLSAQQIASCSPKRKLPARKNRKKITKSNRGSRTSLVTRYSPDSSQTDKSQSFDTPEKFSRFHESFSKKSPPVFQNIPSAVRKPKRAELLTFPLKQSTPVGKERDKKPRAPLTISTPAKSDQYSKQPDKETNPVNSKRRITPTLVTLEKDSFEENEETKAFFDSSPILEGSGSSLDSEGSSPQKVASDKKMTKLEKKMRKGHKNDAKKMPLSAFLASNVKQSTTEKSSPKVMPCAPFTPDIQKGYQKRLISSPFCGEESPSLGFTSIEFQSSFDDQIEIVKDDPFSVESITNKDKIAVFADIYQCIFEENLIPNITMELCFLFGVLNCKIENDYKILSDDIFASADNCVYFVTEILERTKSILIMLDKNCLKLLSENPRLRKLSPGIVECVNDYLLRMNEGKRMSMYTSAHSRSLGIPFQVELNNRKTFTSDRYFYSFSKLRDKFYGLIRNWEENHLNPEWDVQSELGKEFQEFFHGHNEFPTYHQFSQLFISQLVEMCKQDFSVLLGKDGDKMTSLPSYLRGTDPAKLQLLQERFFVPVISRGPCPKPHFTDVETFFKVFLESVDSYQFNIHLKDTMASRLLELNSHKLSPESDENMNFEENEEFSALITEFCSLTSEARLLAKFLGFVVFLPYSSDSKSRKVDEELSLKVPLAQPFDPVVIIADAIENGGVIFTVSWLVMYLAMMDLSSLKLKVNRKAFAALFALYRHPYLRFGPNLLPFNKILILVQLGWLFEQPNIAASISFYHTIQHGNSSLVDDKDRGLLSLGDDKLITKALLMRFCPFLSELKLPLTYAGAKSYRKIKPITHIEKLPDVNEDKKLKEKMIENFLKYQPKYVKESADFIVERLFNNLKTAATTDKLPETVKKSILLMENDIVNSNDGILEIEVMHKDNDLLFNRVLKQTREDLSTSIHKETESYCDANIMKAVSALLPSEVHEKVISAATKIISNEIKIKISDWTTGKFLSLYENELNAAYNRYLMHILKKHNKSITSL